MRTLSEKIQYIFWCVFSVLATIALLVFIITEKDRSEEQNKLNRQTIYEYMKQEIESTNSQQIIILGGEYSATRLEQPYQHCIKICKLQKFSIAGAGDDTVQGKYKK